MVLIQSLELSESPNSKMQKALKLIGLCHLPYPSGLSPKKNKKTKNKRKSSWKQRKRGDSACQFLSGMNFKPGKLDEWWASPGGNRVGKIARNTLAITNDVSFFGLYIRRQLAVRHGLASREEELLSLGEEDMMAARANK